MIKKKHFNNILSQLQILQDTLQGFNFIIIAMKFYECLTISRIWLTSFSDKIHHS